MTAIMLNLWAGPGTGKSTTAAVVFHLLKVAGVKCEICFEFAKELTYLGRREELRDQVWVSATQEHRHWILHDKVDVIISDSPTGMGRAYAKQWNDGDLVTRMARQARARYKGHIDILLTRDPRREFQAYGRKERTLEEAKQKDRLVEAVMRHTLGPDAIIKTLPATPDAGKVLFNLVRTELANNGN